MHAGSVIGAHWLSCSTECEILVPRPGIEPTSLALQGRFLTTEPPGKSPKLFPCTSIRCPGIRLGPGQNTGNSLLLWPGVGRGTSGSPFHLPRTFPHKEKKSYDTEEAGANLLSSDPKDENLPLPPAKFICLMVWGEAGNESGSRIPP